MMLKILEPYTIVPPDLYVERDADRQIKQVVDNMSKPGYVMVARQMGKTNLLLHTKDVMENERNVFAYIDFTSTICQTESECYDEIIDIITETHPNVFPDEIAVIEERRNHRGPTSQREFTRDLRLLIRNIDKLVIIMDEIDALVRLPFSDNVFSLIRSHFFQRKNYPDMNKLTYLLSGVIEPKNIIKNPDISPFNIVQNIYVKDFTREEFYSFMGKTGLRNTFSEEILEKLYFWTNGHPRITTDLSLLISEKQPSCVQDVDQIVKEAYLITCNKVPVDSIRTLVANDNELRDAVLQLNYNRADGLSSDLKNKLYLAGIINLDSNGVKFKNPIIKESLPIAWLMRQGDINRDFDAGLDKAEMLIRINHDYNGALVVLDTLFKAVGDVVNDRLYFLEGECNYKLFRNRASLNYLERIDENSTFYVSALWLLGLNHKELRQYNNAIDYYTKALKFNNNDDVLFKLRIALVDVYIEKGDADSLKKAESLLVQIQEQGLSDYHQSALSFYYCSLLKERQKDNSQAVSYAESALVYAQEYERPKLIYRMLVNTTDEVRKVEILQQLIDCLKEINRPQPTVDFENVLTYSQYDAMVIFADVILNYPTYISEIEVLFKQFYNKREDLYCVICATLDENGKPLTLRMARHIMNLYQNGEFELLDFQIVDVFAIWARNCIDRDELVKIGEQLHRYLKELRAEVNIPSELIRPLGLSLEKKTRTMDIPYVRSVVTVAEKWFRTIPKAPAYEEHFLMVSFYTAIVAFAEKKYNWFVDAGSMYLSRMETFISKTSPNEKLDISLDSLKKTMQMVMSMGVEFTKIRQMFIKDLAPDVSRNSQVLIYDHIHKMEIKGKYKTFEREIESGFYEIREVLS